MRCCRNDCWSARKSQQQLEWCQAGGAEGCPICGAEMVEVQSSEVKRVMWWWRMSADPSKLDIRTIGRLETKLILQEQLAKVSSARRLGTTYQ